jgi:hypothetical protein
MEEMSNCFIITLIKKIDDKCMNTKSFQRNRGPKQTLMQEWQLQPLPNVPLLKVSNRRKFILSGKGKALNKLQSKKSNLKFNN